MTYGMCRGLVSATSGGVLPSELLDCRAAVASRRSPGGVRTYWHAGHEQMSEVRLLPTEPDRCAARSQLKGSGGKKTHGMQNMSSDVWRFVASSPRLLTVARRAEGPEVST
jgi:hypothetical protein